MYLDTAKALIWSVPKILAIFCVRKEKLFVLGVLEVVPLQVGSHLFDAFGPVGHRHADDLGKVLGKSHWFGESCLLLVSGHLVEVDFLIASFVEFKLGMLFVFDRKY